jgi:hypothetical protein
MVGVVCLDGGLVATVTSKNNNKTPRKKARTSVQPETEPASRQSAVGSRQSAVGSDSVILRQLLDVAGWRSTIPNQGLVVHRSMQGYPLGSESYLRKTSYHSLRMCHEPHGRFRSKSISIISSAPSSCCCSLAP